MRARAYIEIIVFAWVFLVNVLPVHAAELTRPFRDKWAVVIGISKFSNPNLDLKFADKDAGAFYDYLINRSAFAKDHVKLLLNQNASRRKILSTLGSGWLSRVAGPDDLVVIYISSHGSPPELDLEGVNYLLAADSDPDDLYSSGVDMQALARMIKAKIHSDRVVLIMDTCYSGAGAASAKGLKRKANVDAERIAVTSGQIVIASSLPDQVSWESASKPNGVFTDCLIQALQKNGKNTSLAEAFLQLKEKVQATVLRERGELQTPLMKSPWSENKICLAATAADPQEPLIEETDQTDLSLKETMKVHKLDGGSQGASRSESSLLTETKVFEDKVVLLPFVEGGITGVEDSDFDFDGMGSYLEGLARLQLTQILAEKLLSPYEVGAALAKTRLAGVWNQETCRALGKACQAKYIVKVNLNEARFKADGGCEASVSLVVASGETGEYIWSGGQKSEGQICKGDSAEKQVFLKTKVLPSFARFIGRAVPAVISRN